MIRSGKLLFIWMILFPVGLLLWVDIGACAAGTGGAVEFKQKIDALKHIQEKVTERIDTALAVRADLTDRGSEFAGEIKDIQQRHRYGSYAEAVSNPRIDYNLKLLQMVSGYTGALDEKIVFFKDSLEQIRFLYRQAEDEFKILQTLGTLENSTLSDRIDRLLVQYRAEVEKDLIVSDHLCLRSCAAIWKEIIDNSL